MRLRRPQPRVAVDRVVDMASAIHDLSQSKPREPRVSYAGREITIIASASDGSFTSMLERLSNRGRRRIAVPVDPETRGIRVGTLLERIDPSSGKVNGFFGRIVAITSNLKRDDWFSEATEWYIDYERPWNQSEMATSLGDCKIEWMEDKLFPRVGRIIATSTESYFRPGDIIRVS